MGRIVFWNALEIFNTKIFRHSEEAMVMIILRYIMLLTGAYDTVKPTPSRMDDTYADVFE